MYRNHKLLSLAKHSPCQNCGADDGTIVAAHGNGSEFGKGIGMKGHDCYICFICHRCHYELDHGKAMSREEKRDMFIRAMHKTWLWLRKNELYWSIAKPAFEASKKLGFEINLGRFDV